MDTSRFEQVKVDEIGNIELYFWTPAGHGIWFKLDQNQALGLHYALDKTLNARAARSWQPEEPV